MGKILFFVLVAAMVCSCDGARTLVNEDFESGKPKGVDISKSRVSDARGEAISGKASLVCDASNTKWGAVAFEFKNADYNAFEVSFDYKTLAGNPRFAPYVEFSYLPKNGGKAVYSSGTDSRFVVGDGKVDHSKNVFHSESGSKSTVKVVVPKGVKMAFDNIKIRAVQVPPEGDWSTDKSVFETCRYNPFSPHYLRLDDKYLSMPKDEFFPFIDKYGQFKHRNWNGKILSDSDFKDRAESERKWLASNPALPMRDKYYGLIDPSRNYGATGRFSTRKVGGKWFFVTPEGNLFWALGMCGLGYSNRFADPTDSPSKHIGKSRLTPVEGREFFYDDVSDPRYAANSAGFKRAYHGMKPARAFDFYARNIELKYGAGVPGKILLLKSRVDSFGINMGGVCAAADRP